MIRETDEVICVYARPSSGPGWSNTPLWVVLKCELTSQVREECIQPEEQGAELQALYKIAAEVDAELMRLVGKLRKRKGGGA